MSRLPDVRTQHVLSKFSGRNQTQHPHLRTQPGPRPPPTKISGRNQMLYRHLRTQPDAVLMPRNATRCSTFSSRCDQNFFITEGSPLYNSLTLVTIELVTI